MTAATHGFSIVLIMARIAVISRGAKVAPG
jgi:hypothetical protein